MHVTDNCHQTLQERITVRSGRGFSYCKNWTELKAWEYNLALTIGCYVPFTELQWFLDCIDYLEEIYLELTHTLSILGKSSIIGGLLCGLLSVRWFPHTSCSLCDRYLIFKSFHAHGPCFFKSFLATWFQDSFLQD